MRDGCDLRGPSPVTAPGLFEPWHRRRLQIRRRQRRRAHRCSSWARATPWDPQRGLQLWGYCPAGRGWDICSAALGEDLCAAARGAVFCTAARGADPCTAARGADLCPHERFVCCRVTPVLGERQDEEPLPHTACVQNWISLRPGRPERTERRPQFRGRESSGDEGLRFLPAMIRRRMRHLMQKHLRESGRSQVFLALFDDAVAIGQAMQERSEFRCLCLASSRDGALHPSSATARSMITGWIGSNMIRGVWVANPRGAAGVSPKTSPPSWTAACSIVCPAFCLHQRRVHC